MAVNFHHYKRTCVRVMCLLACGFVALLLFAEAAGAQNCSPEVPVINVNLSAAPDAVFLSPSVVRAGNCCGTTAPDRCIAFEITLHESAEGIIFDICGGAVPPGALFYQINCGPAIAVGAMICLSGAGPHYLTFCKPGNNQNQYCITSVPAPTAGPDTLASEGCSAVLTSSGYNPATIVWTSVSPGPQGSLDNMLSCTNCENPVVTASQDDLDFADFMVCGMPLGGCNPALVCDTVRVYFASTLAVTIEPDPPAICDGDVNVLVTAIGAGGYPPYIYLWSTGATGNSIVITAPGTYSVQVSDISGCPPADYQFEVNQYNQPVGSNAGPDQLVCSLADPIQLNGSFFGTDSAQWVGGGGTFLPNDYDPQATYIPSPEEIAVGEVVLTLGVLPGGDCPGTTDEVVISIAPFSGILSTDLQNGSCFGLDDGHIIIQIAGTDGPYTVVWDQPGMEGFDISGLPPGTYSATLFNNLGCPEGFAVELTEPLPLQATLSGMSDPLCYASQDGTASIEISGGTTPYEVIWSAQPDFSETAIQNLPAGDHLVSVLDANGCTFEISFSLSAPPELLITVEDGIVLCIGNELELQATASGGTGNLAYIWSHGPNNGSTYLVYPEADTTFHVFATDINGCTSAMAEIDVVVMSMSPDLLWLSPDTGICSGGSVSLEAVYEGPHPPYTYTWEPTLPNGPGPHAVQPETSTTYHVTVRDICGNEVQGQVEIDIFPFPEIHLEDLLLTDCHPASFVLFDTINTTSGFSHLWMVDGLASLSGNPATFQAPAPGSYEVRLQVASEEGCTTTSEDLLFIEVYPSPDANFVILPQVGYIDEPNFTFINQTQGSLSEMSWHVESFSFFNSDTVLYTFADTGTYAIQLNVVNDFGCTDSLIKYATVKPVYNIIIPNAFTPGGSSGGGYYDPAGTSNSIFYPFADYVVDMRMNIFNRWGELIFESNEFRYGWDGTYRDKPCPQDVYVYKIDFKFSDGVLVTRVGDLTLFR